MYSINQNIILLTATINRVAPKKVAEYYTPILPPCHQVLWQMDAMLATLPWSWLQALPDLKSPEVMHRFEPDFCS